MSVSTIKARVTIVRLPEPHEDEEIEAFEGNELDVYPTQYGVRVDHSDGRGHTLIPWARVLRLETRKYVE